MKTLTIENLVKYTGVVLIIAATLYSAITNGFIQP